MRNFLRELFHNSQQSENKQSNNKYEKHMLPRNTFATVTTTTTTTVAPTKQQ
jgi:hypothetical protein